MEITIRVMPSEKVEGKQRLPPLKKRVLKTNMQVTISKIQKFIQKRLQAEGVDISPSEIVIVHDEM